MRGLAVVGADDSATVLALEEEGQLGEGWLLAACGFVPGMSF